MAPNSNDLLPDFPEDHDWTPSCSPQGHLIWPIHLSAMVSTADTQLAPSHDLPKDTEMFNTKATTADALLVALQLTAG